MADEKVNVNRARLKIDRVIKEMNHEIIHGLIPNLSLAELEPFFRLTAIARGSYIKRLVDLAQNKSDLPTDDQVRELNLLRRSYDELIHGAQMLESAIDRGYIEITDE